MSPGLILLLVLASADPPPDASSVVEDPGPRVEARSCGCVPQGCSDRVNDALLDERECRPAHWSCWNDPCDSCTQLAWAPVRIGICLGLASLFIVEPKCGKGRMPELDDVGLFLLFGTPMRKCPEPRIPPDTPPPAPPDENDPGDDGHEPLPEVHEDDDGGAIDVKARMRF